ncbi:MAG: hypothetical protein ABEJ98_00915 [Candidatus Nanohaloarchaea archaeon]
MESTVVIDAEKPGELREVLEPSLTGDETVSYSLETQEKELRIDIETGQLGTLRGCTDTVFRLASLARKQY